MKTDQQVNDSKTFDGVTPPIESHQHWLAQGQVSTSVGYFADEYAPKPAGKFWELIIWLKNDSGNETTVWFSTKEQKGLDLALVLKNGEKINLRAFRVPGVDLANKSLIEDCTGEIGTKLPPGEKTWLLALFDVPGGEEEVKLQFKNIDPISIKLSKSPKSE